ncbi:MAG: hypothetical protein JNL98_27515 [Bryobacterales bacterium]|nr:hypothetical protein [Bryobacterales bacterium]
MTNVAFYLSFNFAMLCFLNGQLEAGLKPQGVSGTHSGEPLALLQSFTNELAQRAAPRLFADGRNKALQAGVREYLARAIQPGLAERIFPRVEKHGVTPCRSRAASVRSEEISFNELALTCMIWDAVEESTTKDSKFAAFFGRRVAGPSIDGRFEAFRRIVSDRLRGFRVQTPWLVAGMFDMQPRERLSHRLYVIQTSRDSDDAHRRGVLDIDAAFTSLAQLLEQKGSVFWLGRSIQAINGFIQWLVFAMGFWCLWILYARSTWRRAQEAYLGQEGPAIPISRVNLPDQPDDNSSLYSMSGTETIGRHEQEIEDRDSALVAWQINVIEILGYLGAVWGGVWAMGGAGDIFSAENHEALRQAVRKLSHNLGNALDPAIVGAFVSRVTGRCLGYVRKRERAAG